MLFFSLGMGQQCKDIFAMWKWMCILSISFSYCLDPLVLTKKAMAHVIFLLQNSRRGCSFALIFFFLTTHPCSFLSNFIQIIPLYSYTCFSFIVRKFKFWNCELSFKIEIPKCVIRLTFRIKFTISYIFYIELYETQ